MNRIFIFFTVLLFSSYSLCFAQYEETNIENFSLKWGKMQDAHAGGSFTQVLDWENRYFSSSNTSGTDILQDYSFTFDKVDDFYLDISTNTASSKYIDVGVGMTIGPRLTPNVATNEGHQSFRVIPMYIQSRYHIDKALNPYILGKIGIAPTIISALNAKDNSENENLGFYLALGTGIQFKFLLIEALGEFASLNFETTSQTSSTYYDSSKGDYVTRIETVTNKLNTDYSRFTLLFGISFGK